ncbi:MAG: hypothetical protein JXA41_05345 [Deltaproteobacteria bacterium]|nr:hypothetical protein [Deltaproteobacteria bacterium]
MSQPEKPQKCFQVFKPTKRGSVMWHFSRFLPEKARAIMSPVYAVMK